MLFLFPLSSSCLASGLCGTAFRPEAALDTTLSWEIMWRVLTGFFKEPYY